MSLEKNDIVAAEAALRDAMLAGDVAALDELLDDAVCFTDQNGNRLSKADDLAGHRSGRLVVETIDTVDGVNVRHCGDCAAVTLTADLAGTYDGSAFFGRYAYSRIWHMSGGQWRVILAHCSGLPATS